MVAQVTNLSALVQGGERQMKKWPAALKPQRTADPMSKKVGGSERHPSHLLPQGAMTCTHPYSHILINAPIHTIYMYMYTIYTYMYIPHITYAMTCTRLYSHTCSYMHIHYMYKYVGVPHMCHGTLTLVLTHAYTYTL